MRSKILIMHLAAEILSAVASGQSSPMSEAEKLGIKYCHFLFSSKVCKLPLQEVTEYYGVLDFMVFELR